MNFLFTVTVLLNLMVFFGDVKAKDILLSRISSQTSPIDWNEEPGNSWAHSCDFPNDDLSNVRVKPEFCSSECRKAAGCTHYFWVNDICYLKKNLYKTKANAINNNNPETLCGILASASIGWYEETGNSWSISCNFPNDDISNVPVIPENCATECFKNPDCTHYYWANNICYLKKNANTAKANAINNKNNKTLCGIIARNGPIYWNEEFGNSWAISCDFPNDALSSVPLVPQLCSSECKKTPGCTHYYWAKDICYLKKNPYTTKVNAINNNNHETMCGILASAPIEWYEETGNSWAKSCDFPYNDLSNVRLRSENCVTECFKTPGCTHYYWADNICYLKKYANIAKANAINNKRDQTLCGIIARDGPIIWNEEPSNSWAISCEFPNDDLSNVPLIPQLCSSECRKTLGCTHYYWENEICYLKKNTKTTKANAMNNNNHETLCGILAPVIPQPPKPLVWNEDSNWVWSLFGGYATVHKNTWANSCNFPNNDLSIVATRRELCYNKCTEYPGCTHYSWVEGLCYLKQIKTILYTTKEKAINTNNNQNLCGMYTTGNYNIDLNLA